MRPRKRAMTMVAALAISAVLPGMRLSGSPGTVMAAENEEAQRMMASREWEIVRETNRLRMEAGLGPLSVTARVQRGADIRIEELLQVNSHTRPNGENFGTVLGEGGNYIAGENICGGFYSASEAMAAWMRSADHRENIVDSRYYHIGARNKDTYWEQLFVICNGNNTDTRILTDGETPVVTVGTSINRLNYFLRFTCSSCGETALMPVIREMCTGYDPDRAGLQTVTVTYGNWTGTFPVNVREKNFIEEIRLSMDQLRLRTREKQRIGAEISPQDVDNPSVTWKSTNTNVAYVDSDNNIVGFAAGIAEIYAVANDGGKRESDGCRGRMYAGETTLDGYYVDGSGRWVP